MIYRARGESDETYNVTSHRLLRLLYCLFMAFSTSSVNANSGLWRRAAGPSRRPFAPSSR